MTNYLKYIVRSILLVFFQVFILNNIDLFGFMNPFLYVVFILILPFKIKHTPLVILSFLMGYFVDLLSGNIMGIHAASAVLLGFLRPSIIRLVSSSQSDYENKYAPNAISMGGKWFFTYAGVLVFVYNLSYFFLEHFTFSGFFKTIFIAIANTAFTLLAIFIYEYLRNRRSSR
ncbi:MAG: rod shape-determining protein MreD [Bacteroidales bacterium]|nr:rod shape-determining protein MreD [Bacteroidales bacterium]MDY0215656.1 rod shape-determining protein MreD [Bacteroidales bacterium]